MDIVGEVWARITGFPDYAVSDQGRVMSIDTGKIRKQSPNRHGYYRLNLFKDGKSCTREIARLVALHHIPNPENKSEVNHKESHRKDDNSVGNLEWMTHEENVQHARERGLLCGYRLPAAPDLAVAA